jgi:hypothetical protein
LSYRGKKGQGYSQQRRASHGSGFSHRARSNRPFEQPSFSSSPADAMSHLDTTPTAEAPMQPNGSEELRLKVLRSFDFNGAITKLSNNIETLRRQAQQIAIIASKKKCEVELASVSGETPRIFRILKLEEAEAPDSLMPYDDAVFRNTQLGALKAELERLGWTLQEKIAPERKLGISKDPFSSATAL